MVSKTDAKARELQSSGRLRVSHEMKLRALVMLGAICVLGCSLLFLRYVLVTPTRTPLLILSCSYFPPWDLNPCESQNVKVMTSLDRHNMTVKRIADPNELVRDRWSDFDDVVAQLHHAAAGDKPLLLYINLHGVVDSDLRPCLLVRDSQPLDESTWIPLKTILDRLDRITKGERSLVLFLESNRQRNLFPMQSTSNPFNEAVDRLVQSIAKSQSDRHVEIVLPGTSRDRTSRAQPGYADPFTQSLADALLGRADQPESGGDSDHIVEMKEVLTSLEQQLQSVGWQRSGNPQRPERATTHRSDLRLAWAGKALEFKPDVGSTTFQGSEQEQVAAIWRKVESLEPNAPWHLHPARWSTLLKLAVSFETAAMSDTVSESRGADFASRFWRLAEEYDEKGTLGSKDPLDLDLRISSKAAVVWSGMAEEPTRVQAIKLLQGNQIFKIENELVTVPFLLHAIDRPSIQLWKAPDVLKRFASAACQIENLRSQANEFPFASFYKNAESDLDERRRALEDRFLADVWDSELETELGGLEQVVESTKQWLQTILAANSAQERALSELPALMPALDAIDATFSDIDRKPFHGQVDRIVEALCSNLNTMRTVVAEESTMPISLIDVSSQLSQMRRDVADCWRRILKEKTYQAPPYDHVLEHLLDTGFLPNEGESIQKAVELRISTLKRLGELRTSSVTKHDQQSSGAPHNYGKCELAMVGLIKNLACYRSDVTNKRDEYARDGLMQRLAMEACLPENGQLIGTDLKNRLAAVMVSRVVASLSLQAVCDTVIRDWQDMQRNQRLVRSCGRVLDDFWETPKALHTPYFARVATELLQKSQSLSADPNCAVDSSSTRELLAARMAAAAKAFSLKAECVPNWQKADELNSSCHVNANGSIEGIPGGRGWLELVSGERSLLQDSKPLPIDIGRRFESQKHSLRAKLNSSKVGNGKTFAQLCFRGHRYQSEFEIMPSKLRVATGMMPSSGNASVLVLDQRPKQRARTLILDCSASMQDSQSLESANGRSDPGTPTPSKLDAARLAIADLLSRWKGGPDWIGVMLYGHRVAVGTPLQGTLMQSRYYSKYPFPQTLRAFEDVESILPIGRFGDQEWSDVIDHLDQLVPWGQTPLYLALSTAIAETKNLGQGVVHDVIVISDGRNYQFNPSPDKDISIEQVLQQAQQAGVRIHIIGFGVPEAEQQQASYEYRRLAEETGGTSSMQMANAMQLVERLQSIAMPDSYSVQLATGEKWFGQCDTPLVLPAQLKENTPIWIEYRNQKHRIPVSPHTALRMLLGSDERMVSATYEDSGEPVRSPILNANGTQTPFLLGVHPPRMRDTGLEWDLSLQRIDEQVAQRPRHVWIEIEPATASVSGTKPDGSYFFADGTWLPNTPNPVLHLNTLDWPQGADRANIRLWCTDQIDPPVQEVALSKQLFSSKEEEPDTLEGTIPGQSVTFQIRYEKNSLTIVLMSREPSTDLQEWIPKWTSPFHSMRVERHYAPQGNLSVHRFLWDMDDTGQSGSQFQSSPAQSERELGAIQFYHVSKFKKHALKLASQITVKITPSMAALPASPLPVLKRIR